MFLVEFWFDSGVNTTQYGGFADEKILDLGPTVWAQRPNVSKYSETKYPPSLLKTGTSARRFSVFWIVFRVN